MLLEQTTDIRPDYDRELVKLNSKKRIWAHLSAEDKADLLDACRARLAPIADRWVATANRERSIAPTSPWAGEEWYELYAIARLLRTASRTLRQLATGEPINIGRSRELFNGQIACRVFPYDLSDRLLFNGITADVWMQPGVNRANLTRFVGSNLAQSSLDGSMALILGAGNLTSIGPLDAISHMVGFNRVALLKLSPVNSYLKPLLDDALAPLVDAGFLVVTQGDANDGRYLAQHPLVDVVHLTGSGRTYEQLVRATEKPVSAELGGVTPVIVLPGPWDDHDVAYQAENIATLKLYNGGFLCTAAQVLVLPQSWPQRGALLNAVKQTMRALPPQPAYYPGVDERVQAALAAYPNAERLGGRVPRALIDIDHSAEWLREELFAPILTVITLPSNSEAEFLHNAVGFCNEHITGTLAVELIVHPKTAKAIKRPLRRAIANLRYGAIGVNALAGLAYRIAEAPWGAYQTRDGGSESGIGVVHNALLFDRPQKCVVEGSFWPFPRTLRHGSSVLFPKPPWFVSQRTRTLTARRVAQFELTRRTTHIPGIFAAALRG